MSRESAKLAVRELLGKIEALPMIFDGNSLCAECLWKAMEVAGGSWICSHCAFICRATPIVDKQGEHWLNLNNSLGGTK